MDRRELLRALGLGVLGALAACSSPDAGRDPGDPSSGPASSSAPARRVGLPTERIVPVQPTIDGVPSPYVALTIDDGMTTAIVAAFAELIRTTGLRITFFANGLYDSWRAAAPALRPMVESGQVQIANHTWSHPDITRLSDAHLVEELARNETELAGLYGISTRPFFRPPWMLHDERTDRICAAEGYPILAHWSGTFGDLTRGITAADVLRHARAELVAGAVMIGHANEPAVADVLDQIAALVAGRGLIPVTLADVYASA